MNILCGAEVCGGGRKGAELDDEPHVEVGAVVGMAGLLDDGGMVSEGGLAGCK